MKSVTFFSMAPLPILLFWRHFWSILNSRIGDWLSELIPLILLLFGIFELHGRKKIEKIYETLFLVLVVTCTLVFINKFFLIKLLEFHRLSPSLVLGNHISLVESFPYLNNKDLSYQSFPGDHATRIFLSSFLMFSISRPLLAWLSFLTGTIFILPRLFSGAHWLSDILLGALAISTLVWMFSVLTPLKHTFVTRLTTLFKKGKQDLLPRAE